MPSKWLEHPAWLAELVDAVMNDIQGGERLSGLRLVVIEEDPANFGVGINEHGGGSVGAGSNEMIGPATPRTQALVTLAEALQEKCAETRVGWGQSRPPCPFHRILYAPSHAMAKPGGPASSVTRRCIGSGAVKSWPLPAEREIVADRTASLAHSPHRRPRLMTAAGFRIPLTGTSTSSPRETTPSATNQKPRSPRESALLFVAHAPSASA
jgi:hypothetical protein